MILKKEFQHSFPSEHSFLNLRQAISSLVLNDKDFLFLYNHSHDESLFKTICILIYQESLRHPQKSLAILALKSKINDSIYPINEWLESINDIYSWSLKNDVKTHFMNILNYISCCEQSPETLCSHVSLRYIISEMLNLYGHNGIAS